MQQAINTISFAEWATEAEPKIRQSLTAAFGVQVGKDAAADALAVAWERWDRVSVMGSPIGYVYGIGRNMARRMKTRRQPMFVEVPEQLLANVEPACRQPSPIYRNSNGSPSRCSTALAGR